MGIEEAEASITMNAARGGFPAWFFFASMKAIGCPLIRLEDASEINRCYALVRNHLGNSGISHEYGGNFDCADQVGGRWSH